jgi:hypothetical protein
MSILSDGTRDVVTVRLAHETECEACLSTPLGLAAEAFACGAYVAVCKARGKPIPEGMTSTYSYLLLHLRMRTHADVYRLRRIAAD